MSPIGAKVLLMLSLTIIAQPLTMPMNFAQGKERYITEYAIPTPHSGPISITVDPEGMIWFAETNATKIARFNPEDKTFKEYDIPTVSSRLQKEGAQIWGMKFDSRGNLWFTELYGDRIGRLDPSRVVNNTWEGISEYSIPTPEAGATGILFDRDENLWFAESFSKKVAMLDTREISFKEYELPIPVYALVGIAFDNEGWLWITDHGSSKFYRFNPQTSEFREYSTSESIFSPVSLPYYIVSDSKGRIWMNEHYGNIIAVMDPEREVLTEYDIPTRDPRFGGIANVLYLTVDRDDNIWFTEWTSNKIAVLDTHLPIPFSIETSERTVYIDQGEEANITVRLTSDGMLDSPVHLYTAGTFTTTGTLEGLEASFEPGELTPERSASTLTIKLDRTLMLGVYTLMVGGKYHDISRLVAVELVVGSPSISLPFFETWGLLLLALTPILVIAIYASFRRFLRRSSE